MTQQRGNGVVAKILAGIIVAMIGGFLAGRFTAPGEALELRVRTNEKAVATMQADIIWIRSALEKKGFAP